MSAPRSPQTSSRLDGRRVLLGVTGGVAAYKAAHLARILTAAGADVTVVMTESATRFIGADTFAALTGNPVHTSMWERAGEVLHVRLAHQTDVAVVAPATAHVIAKLALGLADDYGTVESVARDVVKAEVVVDYTERQSIGERFARRMGASLGASFAGGFIDAASKAARLR